MRRTSAQATQLSVAMSDCGVDVSPRRLEDWTSKRLGAPEALPLQEQVAHSFALADVARSGREADVVALRLAARGYACDRLRDALLGILELGPNVVEVPKLDLSSGPGGDEGFAQIEQIAQALQLGAESLPRAMASVVAALRRNADRWSTALGEPGEDVFHSFLVNGLCHMFGGDLYNEKALAAVVAIDPDTVGGDVIESMNSELRISPVDIDLAYRSAPLEDIACLARWLRLLAPAALGYLGIADLPEGDVDTLAAIFAPMGICLLRLVGSNVAEVSELLAQDVVAGILQTATTSRPALSA